ncbi:helix-turn-helix domain-containing protein [uncultured Intestinimonas sp.]|uniref:helix-turn-helix domain-containing protein n=1 Tax=uncultured Intestinimonas sp. TaxID=1689265 RepID=UPI0025CEA7FE|nr:helix-turn-helix domain-containing protein [uncultured Intestinimonas sp.]
MERYERGLLRQAMSQMGSISGKARLLGISRRNLKDKLQNFLRGLSHKTGRQGSTRRGCQTGKTGDERALTVFCCQDTRLGTGLASI